MIKITLFFLILLAGACSSFVGNKICQAKKSDCVKCASVESELEKGKINLSVKEFELDNGLKILVHENHKLPIFSYYTFFNVGGRNEPPDRIGATHFLEHMMFKGTTKFGPGVFDNYIEESGGMNNAYTSRDMTVYHEDMPNQELVKTIELESDRMTNLALDGVEFDNEIDVVLDERLRNYDTDPGEKLFLRMMVDVFKGTPYGRSVLGTESEIKNLTRSKIIEYYKAYYAPNNATVVVSGDVDADRVYREIKNKYGPIPKSLSIKDNSTTTVAPEDFMFKSKLSGEVNLHGINDVPMFLIAFKGEPLGSRRGFVMDILSSILGDGESSHFYQNFVKGKHPLLASISVGNFTLMKNGVFYIQGKFLKNSKQALDIFKRKIEKDYLTICEQAISKRSVQKTKNQFLMGYYSAIRSNSGIADFLGAREIYFNDYSFYNRELEIYESVTDDEVKGVCESVFSNGERIFFSIWKNNSEA